MNNIGFYAIVVIVMGFRDLFFYCQEYIFKVNETVFRSKYLKDNPYMCIDQNNCLLCKIFCLF